MTELVSGKFTRLALGFVVMVVFSSLTYTLLSYGVELLFPYIIFVTFACIIISVLFYLPLWIFMYKISMWNAPAVVISTFIFSVLIFLAWNIFSLGGAMLIVEGAEVLVDGGRITLHGYMSAIKDSVVTAVISALGVILFWYIARSKKS